MPTKVSVKANSIIEIVYTRAAVQQAATMFAYSIRLVEYNSEPAMHQTYVHLRCRGEYPDVTFAFNKGEEAEAWRLYTKMAKIVRDLQEPSKGGTLIGGLTGQLNDSGRMAEQTEEPDVVSGVNEDGDSTD